MPFSDSQIQDLAISTQKALGPPTFRQIAQNLTHYEVAGYMLQRDRVVLQSGNGINERVMMDLSQGSAMSAMYEDDDVHVSDTMREINFPWRHLKTYYAWERREMLMNRGEARLTDLMSIRRTDAMLAQAELLEAQYWSKPTDSSDSRSLFGVFYWLVGNATRGFNGGNATGFSGGPGGLDASLSRNAKWMNYTAEFTNVTKPDLIFEMRRAKRKIGFKSPVPGGEQASLDYRIYTGIENIEGLESIGESQNENLGRDIASMDGQITFHGNPIVWVEKLDLANKSDRPMLFHNRDCMKIYFLAGDVLRESEPDKVSNNHNVMAVFIDSTLNVGCKDRRRNAYIRKAS